MAFPGVAALISRACAVARTHHHWTAERLCVETGIGREVLRRWLMGDIRIETDLPAIQRLCLLAGIPAPPASPPPGTDRPTR